MAEILPNSARKLPLGGKAATPAEYAVGKEVGVKKVKGRRKGNKGEEQGGYLNGQGIDVVLYMLQGP